ALNLAKDRPLSDDFGVSRHPRRSYANAARRRNLRHPPTVQQYQYSDTLVAMTFIVNPSAGQPLYLQLIHQIRHAIETGVLQPGDPLPALRTRAQHHVMSPNTVVKAYAELERDGWIEIRHRPDACVSARHGMRPNAARIRSA